MAKEFVFDSWKGQETSLLRSVQIGSGAHQASNTMGAGDPSPEIKWQRPKTDHTIPSSDRVENGTAMSILPFPHTSSLHGA
jgi:hypothetical protein